MIEALEIMHFVIKAIFLRHAVTEDMLITTG